MSEAPERIWAEQHFWPNVDKSGDCWVWTAAKLGQGYGAISPAQGARRTGAHRFSWALHNGRWPERGQVVMHSCDNPACVNPKHLSAGTQSENIRQCVERGRHKPFRPPPKSHCPKGHEYTEANTQFVSSRGKPVRRCKTCITQANAIWQMENRERVLEYKRKWREARA